MKTAIKSAFKVAAATAAVIGTVATPGAASAFSRPTYSLAQINNGNLGNTITFNSIVYDASTDTYVSGMLKNETNFVGARLDDGNHGAQNIWEGDEIIAQDGQTYIVRIYVHNNNPNGEAATAENTMIRFYVPWGASTERTVNGWLTATNATPNTYLDNVIFKSADGAAFHLEYVPGTALYENNGDASGAGIQLSDRVVNQGSGSANLDDSWTLIGYKYNQVTKQFDGKIPGCYKYAGIATIKVKVVYDRDFTIEKKVRLAGEVEWHKTVEAQVGDRVEFLITYTNTSDGREAGVTIRDYLPENLQFVDGSTKLYNGLHPTGAEITDDYLTTVGMKIGNYGARSNAKLLFTTEVVDKSLACGSNTLVNWGQGEIDGSDAIIEDYATVHLNKVCEEEPPVEKLPNTGPTALVGGLMAAGATTTAAGYYIVSRRQLRK